MARLKPEPAVDRVVAAVPGVPVGHPGGGAPLRVLHRGGPRCLSCERVRVAQADALAEQGRLRAAAGGAVAEPRDLVADDRRLRGRRGQQRRRDRAGPGPRRRAGVLRRARREVGAAGARGDAVGARAAAVPAAADGVWTAAAFRPAAAVPGLEVRAAGPDDLQTALRIDSTAFGLDLQREPALARAAAGGASGWSSRWRRSTARRRGPPTCCAPTAARGRAPTWPAWRCCRRRGGAGWARASPRGCSSAAFERGAELAHLNPDTDAAARHLRAARLHRAARARHLHRALAPR